MGSALASGAAPELGATPLRCAHGVVIAAMTIILIFVLRAAPPRVRWRGPILFDAQIRDRARLRSARARALAARASDCLLWGVCAFPIAVDAGLVVIAARGHMVLGLRMLAMDATSLLMAGVLVMVIKHLAARERPTDEGQAKWLHVERNLSFIGGHTAMTFTGAGLIAAQHTHLPIYGHRGDLSAMVLAWCAAALVSLLRVLADKHYASDVLVGAAVGIACGWAMPLLIF